MQLQASKTVDTLKKIAEKKKKLEQKERLLKGKDRKAQIRRFIEIGTLAAKFDLGTLDIPTLTGAFAEIQEKAKHSPTLEQWRKKGQLLESTRLLKLIVYFVQDPDESMKRSLKEKQFRCNSWKRQEWYGYGSKEELENLVQTAGGKVEIAND
jgi:hypothetical protein